MNETKGHTDMNVGSSFAVSGSQCNKNVKEMLRERKGMLANMACYDLINTFIRNTLTNIYDLSLPAVHFAQQIQIL